jgi:3,4-dihydroxy 2-butanone 4-phosphate synthase/GTP cyclohydrolase II
LPTPLGEFDLHAFEVGPDNVHLALVVGEVAGARSVLTRVHSECLTGDVLGSLRCDCGVQLRTAMRSVAAEGRGIVVYSLGHEGRGIGLLNKLRAYVLQDEGADTYEANVMMNLPAEARRFDDAAAVIRALEVRSIRLLSNNPAKRDGLQAAGLDVEEMVPVPTAAHVRNIGYLRTKRARMGHHLPSGEELDGHPSHVHDVMDLLGDVRPRDDRPFVVVKLAQTLDGRLATVTGDSRWISGEEERRVSHGLRAASDAVMVGIGTILADDPRLTVRMVPGACPMRVVLDTRLRIPTEARVLDDAAPSLVYTTSRAPAERRFALSSLGVAVRTVPTSREGLSLEAVLADLRRSGLRLVLVEGGSRLATSLFASGLVDRAIVAVAPIIVGSGKEAVGDLGIVRIADAVRIAEPAVHLAGHDVIVAGDVVTSRPAAAGPHRRSIA